MTTPNAVSHIPRRATPPPQYNRGNGATHGNLQAAMPAAVPDSKTETPHERFRRLAAARVDHALNVIRLIGNLKSHNYVYTAADVRQIHQALSTAVDVMIGQFDCKERAKFVFEE